MKYFHVLPQSTQLHSRHTARNVGEKRWHSIGDLLYVVQGMAPSSGLPEFYYTYSFTVFFENVFLWDVTSRSLVGVSPRLWRNVFFHIQGPPVAASTSGGLVSTYKTARCQKLEYHNSESHP